MENVVILGGGIAGTTAAETLRSLNSDVAITIIEQEYHPVYSRVLLPHYIKGKVPREKVFLKNWEWYAAHNIEVMPGVRIEQIDIANRFVRTSEGRELPFDALVIASGGELNTLGGEPRGVSYFRGVDDADDMLTLLRETKMRPENEQHAVVIGGGFIAMEYINIFAHYGIACSVVLRGRGFWSAALSEHSQMVLAKKASEGGVVLHVNAVSPEIVGERNVEGVRLSTGSILPCAMIGVGIGMHPDTAFYEECGIDIEHGIVTNEYLETSHPGVYAVGDAAEFFDTHVARRVVYGNWMNAQTQGRIVAKTIAGERTAFDLVSSYATNLLGMHIVFVGDVDRRAADEVRQIVATDVSSVEEFYRNGKLVGAVLIGEITRRADITARIRSTHILG
jgi:NAD(P)H-nitrite reductase large subunit